MHWSVIGTRENPKVHLQDLVHPSQSVIADALHKFVGLLNDWSFRDGWRLLTWVGRGNINDKSIMQFARSLLFRLSAGVFLCSEIKFSTWPYRFVLLLCPQLSVSVKETLRVEFPEARPC